MEGPKVGDPVWVQGRRHVETKELCPNGQVTDVRDEDNEVDVLFEDGDTQCYMLEAFDIYNDILHRWMIY